MNLKPGELIALIFGIALFIISLFVFSSSVFGGIVLLIIGLTFVYQSLKNTRLLSSRKKTAEGHKVSWELDTSKAHEISERIKKQEKIDDLMPTDLDQERQKELLAYSLLLTVEDFLEDNVISKEEEAIIDNFVSASAYSENDLDKYHALQKIARAIILRKVMEGKIPEESINFQMPIRFNFMKSETLVWAFDNVDYHKEITRRQYKGGHQGVSLRLTKGLYYRTGSFKGRPVEERNMEYQDTGIMALTTKHIYFGSTNKMFRIRYNKIVAFTPYDDGIGIMKDTQSAKPMVFKTGDGWFTYNLVANLAEQME